MDDIEKQLVEVVNEIRQELKLEKFTKKYKEIQEIKESYTTKKYPQLNKNITVLFSAYEDYWYDAIINIILRLRKRKII